MAWISGWLPICLISACIVVHAAVVKGAHMEMGIDADKAGAHLFFKPVHHREDDDQRGHADDNACDRDIGDQRDKAGLALGFEVAQCDEEFVIHTLQFRPHGREKDDIAN